MVFYAYLLKSQGMELAIDIVANLPYNSVVLSVRWWSHLLLSGPSFIDGPLCYCLVPHSYCIISKLDYYYSRRLGLKESLPVCL